MSTVPTIRSLITDDGDITAMTEYIVGLVKSEYKSGRIAKTDYAETLISAVQSSVQQGSAFHLESFTKDAERDLMRAKADEAIHSAKIKGCEAANCEATKRLIVAKTLEAEHKADQIKYLTEITKLEVIDRRVENDITVEKLQLIKCDKELRKAQVKQAHADTMYSTARADKMQYEALILQDKHSLFPIEKSMLESQRQKSLQEVMNLADMGTKLQYEVTLANLTAQVQQQRLAATTHEIELLVHKVRTEASQTYHIAHDKSLLGRQASLLAQQKLGFAADIRIKKASLYADMYNVTKTTDSNAIHDNQYGTTKIAIDAIDGVRVPVTVSG